MADNTTLLPGAGGNTIRDIDKAGIRTQVVTLDLGGAGAEALIAGSLPITGTVTVANPTALGLTDAQLRAAVVPVSPNVTRGAGLLDANVQRVTLATDGASALALVSIDSKTRSAGQAVMAVSAPVVIASNQSAIPVSGPATDAQLRATPLPVAGTRSNAGATLTAGANHLTVGGSDGTNLRPLSTDTTGRLSVIGTFFQGTQPVSIAAMPSTPVTGTFFQATQPVSLATNTPDVTDRAGRLLGTIANTSFAATNAGTFAVQAAATLAAETTKVIGTVNIAAGQTVATVSAVTAITNALPAGANLIGKVGIDQTTPGTTNAVVLTANSLVSTANSTAVNLAVSAVFTGTSEDVSEYSTIMVAAFASHASATDGLSVQQSPDGTNWDLADVYTIPAASGKTFNMAVNAKFYRLVYTNGATLTTSLRIQTIFSKAVKRSSSVRPQDARPNDNDFDEVLAFGMGYNGASWDRLRSTIANGLAVDVTRLPALTTGANTIGAVTGPAAAPLALDATLTNHTLRLQAVTTLTTISVANTTVTLTLPAVAAQFHYLTRIRITMHNTSAAAVVGSAVTLAFTSTNVPGSLAWTEGNALAAGTSKVVVDEVLENPIKSSTVNTATTIVAPAVGAGVQVRITAYYYTAA